MLDRIRAFFTPAASDQEVVDAEPLWRIPEPELALMSDPVTAGRPWEPGEVIDGLFEVLERMPGRIGPAWRLRHLAWGSELRARTPMLVYVSDPRARGALVQSAGKHGEMGVHPNLVATLGVRMVEDVPRILTEVPRGETLRERLSARGPLEDLGRLLDLGLQLCHGLEYAHQHQLTHQDLCAEVCRVDRGGTLRLDQFFPARPWSDVRDLDSRLQKDRSIPEEIRRSLEGAVPGSPLGLPPERWQKPGPATRAGNVYSLGALLFQMAAGRPPFLPYERHGKSAVASLKARVLTEQAPDIRKFRPELPEALAEVVASCLRRDPEERPESVAAVAEVLEKAFRDGTGRASLRPRFAPGRFDAENRNNAALMAFDRGREEEARGKLDDALKVDPEQPEARVNRSLLGWRAGELSAAEGLATLSGLSADLPAARRAELWLLIQGGEERRAGNLLDRMEESERSGWLQNLRGVLLLQEGSARQALTSFERAVAGEPSHWEFHHNLGICLNRTGEREAALKHFEKAVSLTEHPVPRVSLALALAAQGRVADARPHLEAALERDPESAWVHYHLGLFHASMGLRAPGFDSAPTDLDASEQHLEAAVARAAGFYRARDALAECRRRKGSDKPLPGLWEGHPTAPELHELGSLWTVRLVRVLSGHNEAVNALTMSWDGRFIVSAGHDDSILVWDPLRGEVKARLRGHAGAVRSVSVSADGGTLASGSDDGTARLWQLPSGPTLHTLRGHEGPVTAVALSPAGSVLLTGGDDRTVRVWEARTGDARHVLEGHASRVTAVAVSYDGAVGVSAGVDRSVLVWELVTGGVLADLGDLGEELYGLALSSDSRYLMTGGSARVLRLWDLETGACLKTLEGHENEIRAVSLSPDARFALSGGWDRTVRLWNVATGECIRTMSDHEHQITAVHACADGRFGLSGSLDRTLRMWEWKQELLPLVPGRPPLLLAGADRVYRQEAAGLLAAGVLEEARAAMAAGRLAEAIPALRRVQQLPGRARDPEVLDMLAECTRGARRVGLRDGWCRTVLEGHTNWVLRVAWSPDGRLLASGGLDGLVALWSAPDGENLAWLEGHGREVTSLDFAPDGTRLLSSSADRTLRYWDLETGQAVQVLHGHPADITCGILSRNLPMALSASMDGLVRIWNMETGEPLRDLCGHEGVVFTVGLCRNDRRAATGGADRRIVLWDLPSGSQEKELRGHSGPVTSLSFCPDCARLLSGGEDRRAILWDLLAGEELLRLEGHEGAVRSVHILPEGAFLATASDDGRIRVWHGDGSLARALEGHDGPVRWARFSPDGRFLASAGNDKTLRIWELDWEVEPSAP